MDTLFNDLRRHLLFNYLDGPDACALMSICKVWANHTLKLAEKVHIRTRPMNRDERVERIRNNIFICKWCFGINECINGCKGSTIDSCDTICLNCDTRNALPWFIFNINHLNCEKCGKLIDTSTWKVSSHCCTSCGIVCSKCSPAFVTCEYCDQDGILPHLLDEHLKISCTQTWSGRYREIFKQSEPPPPPLKYIPRRRQRRSPPRRRQRYIPPMRYERAYYPICTDCNDLIEDSRTHNCTWKKWFHNKLW